MPTPRSSASAPSGPPRARRPWVAPAVADLPRLSDLTLTTGSSIPGGGGPGGGGSTVVP